MPSPYVKKGYGEVSKRAEDRIREELILICKECNHILKYYSTSIGPGYYRCSGCYRIVCLDDYK